MTFRTILKYYLLWQASILVIFWASGFILPLREQYLGVGTQAFVENPLLIARANFDGNHYIWIAQNGYGYSEEAFFPLYPNLIKSFTKITRSPVVSGVIISNVAFLLALYMLSKLLSLDLDSKTVKLTITLLLIFPCSFLGYYCGSRIGERGQEKCSSILCKKSKRNEDVRRSFYLSAIKH